MSLRSEGRAAVRVCISPDHPSLPGHFPGGPVVPGVVLLDRLIEAAEASFGAPLQVTALSQVKFLAPLLPGEEAIAQLELEVRAAAGGTSPESPGSTLGVRPHGAVQPSSTSTCTLRFRVERGGQLIAQGSFQLAGENAR